MLAAATSAMAAEPFDGAWSGKSTRTSYCYAPNYEISLTINGGAIDGAVSAGGGKKSAVKSQVGPTGAIASGRVQFEQPPAGTMSGKFSGDDAEIIVEQRGCWIKFALSRAAGSAPVTQEAKAPPAASPPPDNSAKLAEEARQVELARRQAADDADRQAKTEAAKQAAAAEAKAKQDKAVAAEEKARQKQLAEAKTKEDAERKAKADEAARVKAQQLAEAKAAQARAAEVKAKEEQERKAREAAASKPATDELAIEMAFWDSIKSSTSAGDYQAYLSAYPKGRFAALAQSRSQQYARLATASPATTPIPAAKLKSPPPPELALDFGRYYALVIGNNAYGDLPKLETAVNDAVEVGELLRTAYGFDVQVMRNATRSQILGALAELRGKLGENDNLLIYYAGHGYIDTAAEQGYWLPIDAARANPGNWIANTDLTSQVRAMKARHVMIVADSCYSGTLVRDAVISLPSTERVEWLRRLSAKRARTVLASGGVEPVLDGGGGGHSVFAKAFMDALKENDAVLDGQSLFVQVRRPVVVNSTQTPEYADIRQAGHDGGDFLFVKRK